MRLVTVAERCCSAGTYVINALISGGDLNPPTVQRVLWGVMEGAVAAVLLLTGGLAALRRAETGRPDAG